MLSSSVKPLRSTIRIFSRTRPAACFDMQNAIMKITRSMRPGLAAYDGLGSMVVSTRSSPLIRQAVVALTKEPETCEVRKRPK